MTMQQITPALVIGSGLAGCSAALSLADAGHEVILVNAGEELADGNSTLAQGGIIYKDDQNPQDALALEKDILVAGHNYNSQSAVQWLCAHGPSCVEDILINRVKTPFDKKENGHYDLTKEGGHSAFRILHTADYTGRAIMESMQKVIEKHPKIKILHRRSAIDLITTHHHAKKSPYRYEVDNRCLGAYLFNEETGETESVLADYTVLATGGVGHVFLHTTNNSACVGAGISMSFRAGVALANLEFMQFHPTALYAKHGSRRPLITEAMRGEGGRLLDENGHEFMKKYDTRGDLAPRDIVAQAMLDEMQHSGATSMFLDASRIEHDLPTRFPTVFEECMKVNIDIRKDPIPVVPAAHYFCGGILTDKYGATSLKGLYAVGECACTGLHGANRLASTSLLEALVWGANCGKKISTSLDNEKSLPDDIAQFIRPWEDAGDDKRDDPALVAQDWATIRNTMWNYVGISRTKGRLKRAFEDLRVLVRNIHEFYKYTRISKRLIDLFHGSQTAYVITQAAMRNPESLGCHHVEN